LKKQSVPLINWKMANIFTIVVTYNAMQWVDRCISSLRDSKEKTEVIVVDNASKDGTVAYIKSRYPFVHIIESVKNLGFGMANNMGLKRAIEQGGDFFFLLNQDAWVEKNTIGELKDSMEGKEKPYGLLSPVHLTGKGDMMDKKFCEYVYGEHSDRKRFQGVFPERNKPENARIIDVKFVNAAAWFITKEALLMTGGFDPLFFHYGEDVNFMNRFHFMGGRAGVLESSVIYHDREERVAREMTFRRHLETERIKWYNVITNANEGFLNSFFGSEWSLVKAGAVFFVKGKWREWILSLNLFFHLLLLFNTIRLKRKLYLFKTPFLS
jgi:GT2 family glycosyltransferase